MVAGLQKITDMLASLRETPLGYHVEDLEVDYASLRSSLEVLTNASRLGTLRLTSTAAGLDLRSSSRRTGKEVDLNSTELLKHIPPGVDYWMASGESSLVQVLLSLSDQTLDRVESRAALAELSSRKPGISPEMLGKIQKVILKQIEQLKQFEDQFDSGWALIAIAEGDLIVEGQPFRIPSIAVIGRPKSKNSGLSFSRMFLQPIAESMKSKLIFGDSDISLRPVRGSLLGPGSSPHSFMHNGLLVISTNNRLSARIRSHDTHPIARPSSSFAHQTSGRRLGHLVTWGANSFRLFGGEFAQAGTQAANVLADACRLFGSVHSESIIKGDEIITRTVAEYAEYQVTLAAATLAKVRSTLGIDKLPPDHMLIAKGEATYVGQEGRFEFVYDAHGRFRQQVFTAYPLDIAFDGTAIVNDSGSGPIRYGGIGAGNGRSWALGASGLWARKNIGIALSMGERTLDEITIRYRTESDSNDRRITIDASTMLPLSMDYSADYPYSFSNPTSLLDYRRVSGIMLPYRITTADGNDYRVESWSVAKLDSKRVSIAPAPHFRYVEGAAPVTLENDNGWLLAEGSIGTHKGWIALNPLRESRWVHADIQPEVKKSKAGNLVLKDIRFGPLSAAKFTFYRTELPEINGKQVLAMVGTQALQGCCVRVTLKTNRTEILPPGSFDGEGFWPMSGIHSHRVFRCRLRGDAMSWFSPITTEDSFALLKPSTARAFYAMSRTDQGPLIRGLTVDFIDLAGMRADPHRTFMLSPTNQMSTDLTPIALSTAPFKRAILEMDFPKGTYHLRR